MRGTRLVYTKWGGHPHWECDALELGADEHGTWIGIRPGTVLTRPGVSFAPDHPQVTLLPADGAFAATFYPPGHDTPQIYVDIATPPEWSEDRVHLVDLDLDVIRGWSGRVWVDDEDEFAQHRLSLGYPDELVELARRSCDSVLDAVRAERPPYDGVAARRWMQVLEQAMMGR